MEPGLELCSQCDGGVVGDDGGGGGGVVGDDSADGVWLVTMVVMAVWTW